VKRSAVWRLRYCIASSYNLSRPVRACELRIASVILEEARIQIRRPLLRVFCCAHKVSSPLCIARGRGCAKKVGSRCKPQPTAE